MKRNRIYWLFSLVLVLTLVSFTLVSGTYAKYTTSISGTDSARVAKFDVLANSSFDGTDVVSFRLFETILDEEDDLAETDVETGLIAPGTYGMIELLLENDSEVTVNYAVDYTVDEDGVPIEFSIDDKVTWTTDVADVSATAIAKGVDETITVYWRWAYSVDVTGDTADTLLGVAGTAEPSVTVEVTFTQVD
jgi:hypothetical protein